MLLDPLVIAIFGSGAIGIGSPIIYVIASTPNWKTSWNRRLDVSGPVLDCIEEDNGDSSYRVVLNLTSDRSNDLRKAIELRLIEKGMNSGARERIVWSSVSEGSWADQMSFKWEKNGKVKIAIRIRKDWASSFAYFVCNNRGFTIAGEALGGRDAARESVRVNLNVYDKVGCKHSFGKAECEVNIASGSNLKWGTNFRPKLIFTAF